MSSSVITQQSTGLATETQSGLVSTGTQSFAGNKTFAGAYSVRTIEQVGVPNLGTHAGYLILAKAYVSGLQEVSEITGTFLLSRGGTGAGNRGDTYTVVSRSAYNSEGLIVQISVAGSRFFTRTVKVTYQGTVYHAIETTATGGEPQNGISFQGVIKNTTPIYVDATYVSNISSFGNYTILENGSLLTPQRPVFNVSSSISAGNNAQQTYNKTYINVGSCFSTATSRFTAPIAGTYYFEWSTIKASSDTVNVHRQYIRKNGALELDERHLRLTETSNYGDGTCSAILSLAANDYIDIYIQNSGVASHPAHTYTWFHGYLIG